MSDAPCLHKSFIYCVTSPARIGMSEYPTPCVGYSDSRREKFVVSAKPNGYSYGRIELYSSAIAASISNQAERAQAQGQFMGELTRAGTAYDVGKLKALATRIRGITGI